MNVNKKSKVPHICPMCGTAFVGDKHRRKYCCADCRVQYRYNITHMPKPPKPPKIIKCAICGNDFEAECGSLRKYCSAACKRIAQNRRASERRIANYTPIERTCQVCGKRFFLHESPAKIYCSDTCRAIGDRRRHERYYNANREAFREKHAKKMANRGLLTPHSRRIANGPIARLRTAKGLQQRQLAEIVGCDPTIISRWETSVSRPNRASAIKLARALDCTVSEIYGISPPGSGPAHAATGGDNSIARLREERGMPREQLAEALGCHVSSIQHWEHGLYPPGPKYAVKLAEILGCNPNEILDKNGGTE